MARPISAIKQAVQLSRREAEEQETRLKARALGVGYVNLQTFPIQVEILHAFGEEVPKKYRLIPYLRIGRLYRVASDEWNEGKREYLKS